MLKKTLYATVALGLFAAAPATAARLRLPPARTPAGSIYSPVAIASELAKRGYRIDKMKRKGTAYSVTATGPHGNRVQMLVDGRSGDIVGLTVLQAAANLIGVVAEAMKSGKSARYYDDTRPFGVIVPDRYQVNWTQITVNDWSPKRGAARYIVAPISGLGYRYAVPYRTVRPAAAGGTRSTYSIQQLSHPLYDVYDAGGVQLSSVDVREDSLVISQVTTEETRYASQDERIESSYEKSYFGSDVDEASFEQAYDYDAEDGDYDFSDNAGDGYDSEIETGDFNDYQANVDDDDFDNDGILDNDDADDDNDGTVDAQDNDDDNDGISDAQDNDDDNDGTLDSQDDDSGNYDVDDDGGPDDQADDPGADDDQADDPGDDSDGGDDGDEGPGTILTIAA